MQNDRDDRIKELLADLRVTRTFLSRKQQALVTAIAANRPRQADLRHEVRALSEHVMSIIGRVGEELES